VTDTLRQAWAWLTAIVATIAGTLELSEWLSVLGLIVAGLTIVERYYAIRLKRRQLGKTE
jgi:hypothetical protein